MSFFTSLTGLNAATTQLSVTSNNIANAGTTGFKRSRSDFGDIFATSPLQKASTVVGQGTTLKQVTQEFSQGNIELSGNSLDLAVTGEGFFPLRSADGQDLFTRNGSFLLDEQNTVVNSAGQFLKVASVDSLGKADFKADLVPLTIASQTVGEAVATSNIDFSINFPAESLPKTQVDENNLEKIKPFNPDDPSTYAKSAAITIFDDNGNDFLLTFFYRRVGVATSEDPFNKWQTHVVLDGQEITPALGQATSSDGRPLFVDKYGNIVPEDELPVVLNDNLVFQKFNLDDLSDPEVSVPAKVQSGQVDKPYLSDEAGVSFAPAKASTALTVDSTELTDLTGTDTVSLDLTDAAGNVTTVSTTNPASTDISIVNIDKITQDDQLEFKVTDEDSNSRTFTTEKLTAPATGASILASLKKLEAGTEYTFSATPGFNPASTVDLSKIRISRADGVNFSLAATDKKLSGTAAIHENISANSPKLTTNATALTTNGTHLSGTTNRTPASAELTFTNADKIKDNDVFEITLTAENDTPQTFSVPLASGDNVQKILTELEKQEGTAGFEFTADSNPATSIQITRADGRNFKVAKTENMDLDSATVQGMAEDLTTSGKLTTNGTTSSGAVSLTELVNLLNTSAASSDYEIEITNASINEITVSKADGTNFQVKVNTLPTAADGLFSGAIGNTQTILQRDGSNQTDLTSNGTTAPDLSKAFDLTIDEDPNDVNATQAITVDLSALNDPANSSLSGDQVASLMTQEINRQFGDQRFFDLSSNANRQFRMTFDPNPNDGTSTPKRTIDVVIPAKSNYTEQELATEIQSQLRQATGTQIDVAYSRPEKGFVFTPEVTGAAMTISNVPASASLTGSAVPNTLFGLNTLSSEFTLDSRGRYTPEVIPNGDEILPTTGGQQRFGINVEFLPNTEEGGTGGKFTISSGTTGDTSAIRIENMSANAKEFFGFDGDDPTAVLEVKAESGSTAVRGVESTAAKVFGSPVTISPDESFLVDDLSNKFTVTVDNVSETFRLPIGNYNLNSFKTALENRINAMEDSRGNSISGVTVNFDQVNEIFTFESGTTGDSSFFQISGSSRFGLEGIDSSVGQTSTYRPPVSETTANGRPIFVTKDEKGVFREHSTDTTSGLSPLPGSREFTNDPAFRPLFLDKGELTFDTAGNLVSPQGGISLDNVVIGGSGNTLDIDIDYDGSTQFSGDFSVNSQSQNGQPNGSLVAVDIADDGLVTASYSNGTQDLKGKIVLGTFSTPNGLRQLGDSTFLESNESGAPQLGEPGGAGFGTIRAGARERANVDLTSELVDLITAQRNFQANAKAIETSSTLTSTIINIRS
jgi:flagellar hook-basal body protein